MSNGKQREHAPPLAHTHTVYPHAWRPHAIWISICLAHLAACPRRSFERANVLLMAGMSSPGLGGFLFVPPGQICSSGVHLFFCFTPVRKGRLIPVAPGKCICLCLKECSYCLFISLFSLSFFFFFLYFSPSFRPSGTCSHLPAFCSLYLPPFLLPSPTTTTISLSLFPATVHASQRWDIAFLILLTADNIYVLFFNIHFSCSHRPRFGPDTKAQHKHTSPPPPAFTLPSHFHICVFNVLTTFLLHQHLLLLLLCFFFVLEGK